MDLQYHLKLLSEFETTHNLPHTENPAGQYALLSEAIKAHDKSTGTLAILWEWSRGRDEEGDDMLHFRQAYADYMRLLMNVIKVPPSVIDPSKLPGLQQLTEEIATTVINIKKISTGEVQRQIELLLRKYSKPGAGVRYAD